MARDAIVGARYWDGVFDDCFEITGVSNRDDEVYVDLEYDGGIETTITLDQFREESCIEVVNIPEEDDE